MAVWISSDYHFNHDRQFIWGSRGFSSVEEMNDEIVRRHNQIVSPKDDVYILGDLMLGSNAENSIRRINEMNGNKIIIAGNHDTDRRRELYVTELNIPVYDALKIKYSGYHFYLSHYPTLTANLEKESLKQCVLNLFGHTHQQTNFYQDIPFMYHCGLDSHGCYPISLDQIIDEMKAKVKECYEKL